MVSITNIALPAEHERLLSIDSSFPHLVRITPRYKLGFRFQIAAHTRPQRHAVYKREVTTKGSLSGHPERQRTISAKRQILFPALLHPDLRAGACNPRRRRRRGAECRLRPG